MPVRRPLRSLPLAAALLLGALLLPGLAAAWPAWPWPTSEAIARDGFGELTWGTPFAALVKGNKELKKAYPAGQINKIHKADQVAILETRVEYKGQQFPGKLFVSKDGLERVSFTIDVPREEGGLDVTRKPHPLFDDLPAPEDNGGGRYLWKGAATAISTEVRPGIETTRLQVTFQPAARYNAAAAGGSVGIE